MTHAELVALAGVWLKRQRCGIVLMEHRGGYEQPDAIGWKRASESLLVECKVSTADFRADRQKVGRTDPTRRLADRCYYLTPTGLLKVYPNGATYADMLPKGWGLIETDGKRFRVAVEAATLAEIRRDDASYLNERGVLYRELRRYKAQGISYKPLIEAATPASAAAPQETQNEGLRDRSGERDDPRNAVDDSGRSDGDGEHAGRLRGGAGERGERLPGAVGHRAAQETTEVAASVPLPAPHEEPVDKTKIGLYRKFTVTRTDGSSAPGGKHDDCSYYVFDITHDKHAMPALKAYADSCRAEFPLLARDLDALVNGNPLMAYRTHLPAALSASSPSAPATPQLERDGSKQCGRPQVPDGWSYECTRTHAPPPAWVSISAYSRTYGLNRRTVYKLIAAGAVEWYRLKRPVRVVRIKDAPPTDELRAQAKSSEKDSAS